MTRNKKPETVEMVRLNTRISKEVYNWLDEKSSKTGIPKSTLVYLALEQYMQQQQAAAELPKMLEAFQQLKDMGLIKGDIQ